MRLIEAADFSSFRELAGHCLALKGYKEVTVTDGWNDGGADLRVYQLPPNPTGIAFQTTVERAWKPKLREDVLKAKARLKLNNMTLVTSRRIAEAEFFAEAEEIWREYNVRVTKLDSQAIASTFFLEGRTTLALRLLGIDIAEPVVGRSHLSARIGAAYSFVFFSEETHYFKESAIESAILTLAVRTRTISRNELEGQAQVLLNMPDAQTTSISAAVDRMIQKGDLAGPAANLTVKASLADAASAMVVLRDREWSELENGISKLLKSAGIRPTTDRVEQVTEHVGTLLLDVAQNAAGALTSKDPTAVPRVKDRLRELHATLDSMGMSEGRERDQLLEEIARLAGQSAAGKCLLAGELFLSLTPLSTPQLIRALGARAEIRTLLDASVAIPMLAGLLFHPVENRFSLAAHHAYTQLRSHGLPTFLPTDYLEEAAAHLLRAFHDYAEIVDVEQDLTSSENSYVAHYAGLRLRGDEGTFLDFVEAFGLDESLRRADFFVALEALKPRLQRLFDHYSIARLQLGTPSGASQIRAEEAIAYALQFLSENRPQVTAKHDARTLAFLFDTDRTTEAAYVFCTWDGVHFKARERESAQWLALSPVVLGDTLSMAAPSDTSTIASPVVLAKSLSEETTARGAGVWDQLVKIERGTFRDADLLRIAREFKNDYVQHRHAGREAEAIRRTWAEWKSKHYIENKSAPTTGAPEIPKK